jgi:hypothetical protein
MEGAQNSKVCIPVALTCLLALEMALALRLFREDCLARQARAGLSHFSGNHFAVADFDGDWKPDLALVEITSLHPRQANYAIRLQFSTAAAISFDVSGPNEGIVVAARDVNGDDLPDLIVSSAYDQRVVAILLNHGHGLFSRAEPAAYAAFVAEPDLWLHGREASVGDRLTVAALRYSFDGEQVGRTATPFSSPAEGVAAANTLVLPLTQLHVRRGRSPPANVFST